jgi:hypothetical protein
METPALVVDCPPAVLATAVSTWLPLESVVVFSEMLKGVLVTAGPGLLASTLNCTLAVLVEAVAVTAIVPETVAPEVGEVMETLGGAGSEGGVGGVGGVGLPFALLLTLIETPALAAICPPAALATAVSTWLPLESVVVLSEKPKGALVTAGPALLPSTWNCTLVMFAEAVAVTAIVPETVVPVAGELIETLSGTGGVVFFTSVPVTAAQPAQRNANTVNTNVGDNQGTEPG